MTVRHVKKPHWTPEEIALLKTHYATTPDLEALFPGRSVASIHHRAQRTGLERTLKHTHTEATKAKMAASHTAAWQRPDYRLAVTRGVQGDKKPLTYEQEQLVRGTAMGDGHLALRGLDAELIVAHATGDEAYLRWKYEVLKSSGIAREPRLARGTVYGGTDPYYSWRLETSSHPLLTEIHGLLYKDRKRRITPEILEPIDELGLAVWYMDDGCLSFNGEADAGYPLVRICTDAYGKTGAETVARWLQARWGWPFHTYETSRRNGQYIIALSRSAEVRDFLDTLRPFQARGMSRKFRFGN